MKKLIFCLLVMVFCSTVAFAGIVISNTGKTFDLSSVYPEVGELTSEDEVEYDARQVIGTITIDDTTAKTDLELDFSNMQFVFPGQGESTRSYDINLVYKQKTTFRGQETSSFRQSEIIHDVNGKHTFNIPATEGENVSTIEDLELSWTQKFYISLVWLLEGYCLTSEYWGTGILHDGLQHFIEDYASAYVSAVQIDIVLVLPELTAEEEYNMVNSDNGYEGTCKLSTGEEIRFYGSYKGKPENVELSLSVAQNDKSRAIDLDDSSVQPDSSGLDIGTYEYVVTYPAEYDGSHAFYLFASSSDDPTTAGDAFTLIHENGTNALEYEVGLSGGGSLEKWFSGTDSVAIGSGVTNDEAKLLESDNNYSSYAVFDNGRTTRGYGGSILFRLTDAQMNEDPLAGDYSSTIYFHVLSCE